MQADGGCTIERFNGTRAATTFRKLPSASPGAKAIAAKAVPTRGLSAACVPDLRDQRSRSSSKEEGPGNRAFLVLRRLRDLAHAQFWNTFWKRHALRARASHL